MKITPNNTSIQTLFNSGNNVGLQFNTQTAGDQRFYWLPNNNVNEALDSNDPNRPLIVDQSAWYHICMNYDPVNGTWGVWYNGKRYVSESAITSFSDTAQWLAAGNSLNIGGANSNGTVQPWQGYLADVYMIDGLALEPSSFGGYDANGNWVPREYNGSYGENGFNLTFAANTIATTGGVTTCADQSGNGKDFTMTGFDFTPSGDWSQYLTTNTSFSTQQPASDSFNGNLSNRCDAAGQGGVNTYIEWAPPSVDIVGKTIRVNSLTADVVYTLGGATTTASGAGWTTIDKGTADTISSTTPLRQTRQAQSASTGWTAVEIDGVIYIDNTGTDYDLMLDSPTQNYATLNPLVTYEGQIGEFGGNQSTGQRGAADGNLTLNGLSAPGGGQKFGISTQAARGPVYLELTIGTVINGGQGIALFVGSEPRQYQTYYGSPQVYTFQNDGAVRQGDGSLNGTTLIAQYGTLSSGDVASIALDMDNGTA